MPQTEKRFIELCKEYAEQTNAVFHTYEHDKKTCVYQIFYNSIKLEFCYQIKAKTFIPAHTLYCRLYLHKNSVVQYHLCDILSRSDNMDLRCGYFPFIESKERMEHCFRQLSGILDSHKEDIEKAAFYKEETQRKLLDTYKGIFEAKDGDFNLDEANEVGSYMNNYFCSMQRYREDNIIGRFTSYEAYQAFLSGDFDKALKIYKKHAKKGYMLPIELEIIDWLEDPERESFVAIPEECYAQKEAMAVDPENSTELLKLFGIGFVLFGSVFSAAFAVVNAILSKDALLFFGCPWYLGFIAGGLCAVFGGIAFRRQFRKLYKRNLPKANPEIEKLVSPHGVEIFAKTIFALALAFSVFFSVLILFCYVRFDENSFTFNNSEEFIEMVTYGYDDIKGIYYINSRHNSDEQRINRASYVILLKDGCMFDFDGTVSVKKTEKAIIPFLKEKGFEVTVLDSDKDLILQ